MAMGTVIDDVLNPLNVVGELTPITWYPVTGTLSTAGIQWGASVEATAATTNSTLTIGTCNLARNGLIDGLATGGVVQFSLTLGMICSAEGNTAQITSIRFHNSDAAGWSTICGADGTIVVDATTEVERVYNGVVPTTLWFNKTPFIGQVLFQGSNATAMTSVRVKGGTTSWAAFNVVS